MDHAQDADAELEEERRLNAENNQERFGDAEDGPNGRTGDRKCRENSGQDANERESSTIGCSAHLASEPGVDRRVRVFARQSEVFPEVEPGPEFLDGRLPQPQFFDRRGAKQPTRESFLARAEPRCRDQLEQRAGAEEVEVLRIGVRGVVEAQASFALAVPAVLDARQAFIVESRRSPAMPLRTATRGYGGLQDVQKCRPEPAATRRRTNAGRKPATRSNGRYGYRELCISKSNMPLFEPLRDLLQRFETPDVLRMRILQNFGHLIKS